MNLLLDTHVLLWWLDDSPGLGAGARQMIIQAPEVFVSAASIWEIAIKYGIGRLTLPEPPDVCLPRELERTGFRILPVSCDHALAAGRLPWHHKDPFDRMLIAQAATEGMVLVTSDRWVEAYGVRCVDSSLFRTEPDAAE